MDGGASSQLAREPTSLPVDRAPGCVPGPALFPGVFELAQGFRSWHRVSAGVCFQEEACVQLRGLWQGHPALVARWGHR